MGLEDQKRDYSAGAGNVDGRLFRIAHAFVGRSPTRSYLDGVIIEPAEQGVFMVATDGHRMLVVRDETGIVSRPAIIHLPKQTRELLRRATRISIVLAEGGNGSTATVSRDRGEKGEPLTTTHDVEVAGYLVDWRKVAGAGAKRVAGPMSETLLAAPLLAGFTKAAVRFQKSGFSSFAQRGVHIRSHGLDVTIIGFEAGVPAVGFLMPCASKVKGEIQMPALPDWFASFAPADPAPAA